MFLVMVGKLKEQGLCIRVWRGLTDGGILHSFTASSVVCCLRALCTNGQSGANGPLEAVGFGKGLVVAIHRVLDLV